MLKYKKDRFIIEKLISNIYNFHGVVRAITISLALLHKLNSIMVHFKLKLIRLRNL